MRIKSQQAKDRKLSIYLPIYLVVCGLGGYTKLYNTRSDPFGYSVLYLEQYVYPINIDTALYLTIPKLFTSHELSGQPFPSTAR